jgi:outer membrane protein TolC
MAQLAIGNEQYRDALSDIELRLRQAFVEVVYAQDLIELTKQIAERRNNNVRLLQLQFDGGRENAGSLARSKAQRAVADFEVRQAERALAYA